MLPVPVAVAGFLALLAVVLFWGPRRLTGPAWFRQAQLVLTVLLLTGTFAAWAVPRYGPDAKGPWEVGELRANGLRLVPSGPSDASEVLAPASFDHPMSRELYGIAAEIPGIMNQLYCWCGCVKQGRHRSALACFEDTSAVGCGVCQENARIARAQVQQGIRDPARIQRAIDREWAPAGARDEMAAFARSRGWE
jgi:hypothetical protein